MGWDRVWDRLLEIIIILQVYIYISFIFDKYIRKNEKIKEFNDIVRVLAFI